MDENNGFIRRTFDRMKDTAVMLAKDPVTWIAGGLVFFYAVGIHQGKKEGYEQGYADGSRERARELWASSLL